MANLSFSELTKAFDGGTLAVESFDLDIADGEFMVLVGPSGSGKSTALRSIAGLEEITSGTTWTPNCVCRCAARCRSCTSGSASPRCM